jgi:hypothetical protein
MTSGLGSIGASSMMVPDISLLDVFVQIEKFVEMNAKFPIYVKINTPSSLVIKKP